MVRSKKLLFSGLFSAFFLCITSSYGATNEELTAASTSTPLRPTVVPAPSMSVPPQEEAPVGCWTNFTRGLSGCWKKTGDVANVLLPILRDDVLPILQLVALNMNPESNETKQINHIINGIKTGTEVAGMVFHPDNGALTLPNGTTIANALWYLWNEKSEMFTDDSTALGSVVIDCWMKEIKGDSKKYAAITAKLAQLVLLLSKADDPATSFVPGFDADKGIVHLISTTTPHPLISIPLFGTDTTTATQEFLKTCFSEFVPAYQKRTTQEAEKAGERIPGAFLPEGGTVLSYYSKLREGNPLHKIITVITEATA